MRNRKKRKLFGTFFFLAAVALGFSIIYGGKTLAAGLDGTTLMYALDRVNVRSGPGTDTDIIGELEQGETVFAVELTEEGWYRVVYEGEKGYIRQDFLEFYGTEGDWNGRALSEYEALYDAGEEEEAAAPVEPETASGEEPEVPEEPEKPKKNIVPIIIIIAVLMAIIIYSGIQIAAERRQSGQDDDDRDGEDDEDDSDIMELAWEIEEKDES